MHRLLLLAIAELLIIFHLNAEHVTDQCENKNEGKENPQCQGMLEGSNQVKTTETTNLVQRKAVQKKANLQEGDEDSKETQVLDAGEVLKDDTEETLEENEGRPGAYRRSGTYFYGQGKPRDWHRYAPRRRYVAPTPPRRRYVPPPPPAPVPAAVARVIHYANPKSATASTSQCNLSPMELPLVKQAETASGGNSVVGAVISPGGAAAGLGLAGGIMTIGATMGTAAATGGISLMVAGAAAGVLGPLLFPSDPPLTKDDVADIARKGDEQVLNIVNEQMKVVQGCFDSLHAQMKNAEDHNSAMRVYNYMFGKIGDTKAAFYDVQRSNNADTANRRFRHLHRTCNTIHAAITAVRSNIDWKIRGIQYSAPLAHDWASICFAGYIAWSTVHLSFPNAAENADPKWILSEGKHVMEMFETYYWRASLRLRHYGQNYDLGLMRLYQMYTSSFVSNMFFAHNLAKEGKPYPPLPPHGRRKVCHCMEHPPSGYGGRRLLENNATTEASEDTRDFSVLETNATTEESEDVGDSSEFSRPWERQYCRWTTSGQEFCPRRLSCAPRGKLGYETCEIPYYSKRDYCRVCSGTTCTDTVVMNGWEATVKRPPRQARCFQQGGIYIPNW